MIPLNSPLSKYEVRNIFDILELNQSPQMVTNNQGTKMMPDQSIVVEILPFQDVREGLFPPLVFAGWFYPQEISVTGS
jgi:hypothetical protein